MINLRFVFLSLLVFAATFQSFGYSKLDPILRSSDRAGMCRGFYYGGMPAIRHMFHLVRDLERPQAYRLLDARRAFYHYEKYSRKLDKDTLQAINNYKGIGYSAINKLLRSGRPLSDEPILEKQIQQIDSAIDRSPALPANIVLFRGIQLSDPSRVSLERGSEFSDAGFVSTSLAASTASNFAGAGGSEKKMQVLQVIHVRSNKVRGLYLEGESFNTESEILLDRQSRFRVLRSQWVMVENISELLTGIGGPVGITMPPPDVPALQKPQEQLELFPSTKKADPEQQELFPEIALPKDLQNFQQDLNQDPNSQLSLTPPFDPTKLTTPDIPIGGGDLPTAMQPGVPPIVFPGNPGYPGYLGPNSMMSPGKQPEPFKILIQHLEVVQD